VVTAWYLSRYAMSIRASGATMPIAVQWLLAIITVVSSGWSGWMFLHRWRRKAVEAAQEQERKRHLAGVLLSLQTIRMKCVEASVTERVIKTPSEKEFVSGIGYALVGVEKQISLMLGDVVILPAADFRQNCQNSSGVTSG